MTLFVFDIDGTIADSRKRFRKVGPEPKERGPTYKRWLAKVQNHKSLLADPVVSGMKDMVLFLNTFTTAYVIYVTGRSEVYRQVTREWMRNNGLPFTTLLMRPVGNNMTNGRLKHYLITTHRKFINLSSKVKTVVIDDDYNGDIEEMCHNSGWTFLKACSGGVREYGKER